MKKKTLLEVGILITILIFSSCSSDNNPKPLSSYNMSASANGQFLTFDAGVTQGLDSTIDIDGSWPTSTGSWPSTTNETFNLNFLGLKYVKGYVGTYNLRTAITDGCNYNAVPASGQGNIFMYTGDPTNPGSLSITAYDSINHTISGTFTFYGNDTQKGSITLANGVFTKLQF